VCVFVGYLWFVLSIWQFYVFACCVTAGCEGQYSKNGFLVVITSRNIIKKRSPFKTVIGLKWAQQINTFLEMVLYFK